MADFTTADAKHAVMEPTHVTFCDSQAVNFFPFGYTPSRATETGTSPS